MTRRDFWAAFVGVAVLRPTQTWNTAGVPYRRFVYTWYTSPTDYERVEWPHPDGWSNRA